MKPRYYVRPQYTVYRPEYHVIDGQQIPELEIVAIFAATDYEGKAEERANTLVEELNADVA